MTAPAITAPRPVTGLKPLGGLLAGLVQRAQDDLAGRRRRRPEGSLEPEAGGAVRDFAAALRPDDRPVGLIAEVKPRSPSRGELRPVVDPEAVGGLYDRYADAVSCLTNGPDFGGSHRLLSGVRTACSLPVLCKDFVVDAYQVVEARQAGADAVLLMATLLEPGLLADLVVRAAELGMEALVEVHDERELDGALGAGARIVGVNSRDLGTLLVDLDGARQLLKKVPPSLVRVAESGIGCAADVRQLDGLADAALVGTRLMLATDIGAAIEELGWRRRGGARR